MRIAIVGDGPRGLLITSRLTRFAQKSPVKKLLIQIFDRYPIGGRIWQTGQSRLLKMNTAAQQITMFDVTNLRGPNLYQWARKRALRFIKLNRYRNATKLLESVRRLGPNDYAPRCVFGVYLQWFFHLIQTKLPSWIKIRVQHATVTRIERSPSNYRLTLQDGTQINTDRIVLNPGQATNQPGPAAASLAQYANQHRNLHYLSIGYPGEQDLKIIRPQQRIIIRGMGLNFIDEMKLLTIGRGGHFRHLGNQLVYSPSGKEPRIIVGSRRGLPYYCRARNQKTNGRHGRLYFLSTEHLKKHLRNGKISYHTFINLLRLDMERIYYTQLIRTRNSTTVAERFKWQFERVQQPENVIRSLHLQSREKLNWRRLLNPVAGLKITDLKNYREAVLKWLNSIISAAKRGNVRSPLAAALEVIRDSRNSIRELVNHQRFTGTDYVTKFLPIFSSVSRFLSMGAPVGDLERFRALIKAHVITIMGPRMNVVGAGGHFICNSTFYPRAMFKANVVMEARNPIPKISRTRDPLIRQLCQRGFISRPKFSITNGRRVMLDCVNVDPHTDQMIDQNGHLEPDIYIWGPFTEGVHWCTQNAPHSSGHDVNLAAATQIAKQILR